MIELCRNRKFRYRQNTYAILRLRKHYIFKMGIPHLKHLLDNRKGPSDDKKMPVIQKFAQIQIRDTKDPRKKRKMEVEVSKLLFPMLMTNWLLSNKFCSAFINSKSASIIEALNSSCKLVLYVTFKKYLGSFKN